MSALLVKLAAVTNALLLALPAGWCCLDAPVTGDRPAAACQSCTERETSSKHSPSHSAPQEGDLCTCESHPAILAKVEKSAPSGGTPGLPADGIDARPLLSTRGDDVVRALPARAGPRLHVLQCVWRC